MKEKGAESFSICPLFKNNLNVNICVFTHILEVNPFKSKNHASTVSYDNNNKIDICFSIFA